MRRFLLRYAPSILLSFAWALQGAKSNLQFAMWAAAALLFCFLATMHRSPDNDRDLVMPLLALIFVFTVQLGSLDFQHSLFWSFELAIFVILWPFFQTVGTQGFTTPGGLILYESLLAISAIVTIHQIQQNLPGYGLLPINPNFNATWMATGAVFLTAKQARIMDRNIFQKWGEILLTLILTLLVIFGHSRSGFIALFIGFGYIACHSLPRRWLLAAAAGTLVTSLVILNSWLQARFGLLSQSGLRADRLQFWLIALRAIACKPLTGYGLGNFEMAYNQFAFPVIDDLVRYAHSTEFAHNEFLQLLAEMGIPVGGAFILILGSPLVASVRKKHPWDLPAKSSLLVLGAVSFVNPILHMPILVYLGLILASILMQGRTKSADNSFLWRLFPKLPAQPLLTCVLAGLLLVTGYIFVASIWASQGRWEQRVKFNPYDAEAWHQLGTQVMDNLERIEAQRHAVQQSPYNLYYRETLASELESSGLAANYPLAMQHYLQALILCPTRASDDLAVGRLLLRAGDPQAALIWFEKGRSLEPHYWESDLWIARCYRALGQRKKAAFILRNLLTRHAETKMPSNLPGMSPYEQVILGFDEQVLERELK